MEFHISVCSYFQSEALSIALSQQLEGNHFFLSHFTVWDDFLQFIEQNKLHIDCLILQASPELPKCLHQLHSQAILLPLVILGSSQADEEFMMSVPLSSSEVDKDGDAEEGSLDPSSPHQIYHAATLSLPDSKIAQIEQGIHKAISSFLKLSSVQPMNQPSVPSLDSTPANSMSLMVQQQRLAQKLKERLGYLGVYYKRNPASFLRYMTESEKRVLLKQLETDYRGIILNYFSTDPKLNEKIDNFVNVAFFADISVPQIMEIHMELMDEFSKQLKLEGRSDEILIDYRLALIDVIAHLCEMYRRSIPRES